MHTHLTSHLGFRIPALSFEEMRVVWTRLRRAFPEALAATLLPRRVQILLPPSTRPDSQRFSLVLRLGSGRRWLPLAAPSTIPPELLLGTLRAVLSAPARPRAQPGRSVGLVKDSLAWTWSTHRDLVGAVVDPWVPAPRVLTALGWTEPTALDHLHRRVSTCAANEWRGSPLPLQAPPPPAGVSVHPVGDVLLAAAIAHRAPPETATQTGPIRDLAMGLAIHQGWRSPGQLRSIFGLNAQGLRRVRARASRLDLAPGLCCLGDPRLLRPPVHLHRLAAISVAHAGQRNTRVEAA